MKPGKPLVILGNRGEEDALLTRLATELHLTGTLGRGKDAHGRPTLTHQGRALAYSCSHAGDRSALALSLEGRVGVDLVLEVPGEAERLEAHFHASERTWLARLPQEARPLAMTACWAAKEAVLKALGLGLAFGSETVELGMHGPEFHLARIAGQRAEGWHLQVSRSEGHILALAWTG